MQALRASRGILGARGPRRPRARSLCAAVRGRVGDTPRRSPRLHQATAVKASASHCRPRHKTVVTEVGFELATNGIQLYDVPTRHPIMASQAAPQGRRRAHATGGKAGFALAADGAQLYDAARIPDVRGVLARHPRPPRRGRLGVAGALGALGPGGPGVRSRRGTGDPVVVNGGIPGCCESSRESQPRAEFSACLGKVGPGVLRSAERGDRMPRPAADLGTVYALPVYTLVRRVRRR